MAENSNVGVDKVNSIGLFIVKMYSVLLIDSSEMTLLIGYDKLYVLMEDLLCKYRGLAQAI